MLSGASAASAGASATYSQAKAIFDEMLGPEHPQTLAWQQDLFFLINAPVIQSMVKKAATTMGSTDAVARHEDAPTGSDGSAQQWWMKNLFDMKTRADESGAEEGAEVGWWMRNLYEMGYHGQQAGGDGDGTGGGADYMQAIFAGKSDGNATARGGVAFTPRGTLAALSQAAGKTEAAASLGMPKRPLSSDMPADKEEEDEQSKQDAINMGFAADWVSSVFATPRGGPEQASAEVMDAKMGDAYDWLQSSFGVTPRGSPPAKPGEGRRGSTIPITPRGAQPATAKAPTEETDDAVLKAAMQAVLYTPRATPSAPGVDPTAMAGAVSKMFPGRQRI